FRVTGSAVFSVSNTTLQLAVNGSTNGVGPQFTSGVSLSGILTIESGGIWGLLAVDAGTNGTLSGTGFNFSGYVALALNMLNAGRTVTRQILDINQPSLPLVSQTLTLNGSSAFFSISGRLQFRQGSGATATDAFGANGNFAIAVSGSNFSMGGAALVDLGF